MSKETRQVTLIRKDLSAKKLVSNLQWGGFWLGYVSVFTFLQMLDGDWFWGLLGLALVVMNIYFFRTERLTARTALEITGYEPMMMTFLDLIEEERQKEKEKSDDEDL